jgi:alanyl-tRNA synthetase
VRRIEAVCHLAAVEHVQSTTQMLEGLARRLGSGADQAGERLERVYEQLKAAQQEVERWKQKALSGSGGTDAQERTVAGIKAVFRTVEGADAVVLRNLADQTRDKLGSGVVALLSLQEGGKALLLVAATKDVCGKVAAGPLVAELAPLLGGKGGGRPDMAQAGGNAPGDVAALAEAFFAGVAKRAG